MSLKKPNKSDEKYRDVVMQMLSATHSDVEEKAIELGLIHIWAYHCQVGRVSTAH